MTMQLASVLKTFTLGVACAVALAPLSAAAQGRTAPPPAPRTPSPVATSGAAPATPAAARPSTVARSWTDQEYRLGPGDKLRVEVYREPQLSQSLQVRPDGRITLPLVGDVAAAGVTSSAL